MVQIIQIKMKIEINFIFMFELLITKITLVKMHLVFYSDKMHCGD